jgi:putative membrane protein
MRLLLHWFLSALAMLLVAHFVRGFVVKGLVAALLAAAVYGLVNATLGLVIKVLTFPLSIVTLGLFLLVVNALMLQFSAALLPGIEVHGFWPAFWAALLLAILGMLIRGLLPGDEDRRRARD